MLIKQTIVCHFILISMRSSAYAQTGGSRDEGLEREADIYSFIEEHRHTLFSQSLLMPHLSCAYDIILLVITYS